MHLPDELTGHVTAVRGGLAELGDRRHFAAPARVRAALAAARCSRRRASPHVALPGLVELRRYLDRERQLDAEVAARHASYPTEDLRLRVIRGVEATYDKLVDELANADPATRLAVGAEWENRQLAAAEAELRARRAGSSFNVRAAADDVRTLRRSACRWAVVRPRVQARRRSNCARPRRPRARRAVSHSRDGPSDSDGCYDD